MKLPNKYFYFPMIALVVILLIKIIQMSKLITFFPFHLSDTADHISKLYFFAKYGFHGLVPNWYNGFTLFQNYPPFYYFFTLPIYLIIKKLLLTTYITFILSFIIGFIATFIFCKLQKLSTIKSIAFFLFLFANPMFIYNFTNVGRISSIFTWLVIFIPFCIIIFFYKNHKINYKFLILFTLFFSALILSHLYVLIPSTILILSLFLVKNKYEKFIIILSSILSLIITSFWWIPFLKSSLSFNRHSDYLALEMLRLPSLISYNTLILLFFWFTLYFYIKNKSSKEKLFFLPPFILSILLFTRLLIFVPIFNRISPYPYNIFFLFLSLFLFFKAKYSILIKNLIFLALILITIASIFFVFFQMKPLEFEYTELEQDAISIFPQINNNFILIREQKYFDNDRLIAYATTYHNLTTPQGHYPAAANQELLKDFDELFKNLEEKNCHKLTLFLNNHNVKEVITINKHFNFLISCNLRPRINKKHLSLLSY